MYTQPKPIYNIVARTNPLDMHKVRYTLRLGKAPNFVVVWYVKGLTQSFIMSI